MKIIGIADDNVIIEASKDEIANLIGAYSRYQIPEANTGHTASTLFKVGTVFSPHLLYEKMRLIENRLKIKKEYDSARTKLEQMLEALTPIENIIQELKDKIKK